MNSHIDNSTGDLFIKNLADDRDIALQTDNGSGSTTNYLYCDGSAGTVSLYHYGTSKAHTTADGLNVLGELECDSLDVDGNVDRDGGKITFDSGGNVLKWADNVAAYFGTGNDQGITTQAIHINDQGTGSLIIWSNRFELKTRPILQ